MKSSLMMQRPTWLPLLLMLTVTVIFIAFFRLPGDGLLLLELQDTGHTLIFLSLTVVSLHITQGSNTYNPSSNSVRYLVVGLACLAAGIAAELMQLLSDRNFSLVDIVRDLVGIVVAIGLFAVFDPLMKPVWTRHHSVLRIGTFTLANCLLAASLYPLASLAFAVHERQKAAPVIIDLTADWSGPFLQFNHATLSRQPGTDTCQSNSGEPLAGLIYKTASYPGISMLDPYPDWRGYEYLVFTIYTTKPEPFKLYLRIHDQWHTQDYSDSFTRKLGIENGINHFRIPLKEIRQGPPERELDISSIRKIMLFARNIPRPVEFCIGVIGLD